MQGTSLDTSSHVKFKFKFKFARQAIDPQHVHVTVFVKSPDPPGEGRGGEVGEVALSRLSRFSLSRAPTLSCRRPTRARLDARSSSRPAPVT